MSLTTGTIRASPFVGIFGTTTENVTLVPESSQEKEVATLQQSLQTRVVKVSLAGSSVIGCLCRGNTKGFVVPSIVEDREVAEMEKQGLRVKRLDTNLCLGNWVALNDHFLVVHRAFSKKHAEEMASFLGVKVIEVDWTFTELVGTSLVLTNTGFVIDPRIPEKAFLALEEAIGIKGKWSTANYGDVHVGNSVVANTQGAVVGDLSTNVELVAMDDGLSGGSQA